MKSKFSRIALLAGLVLAVSGTAMAEDASVLGRGKPSKDQSAKNNVADMKVAGSKMETALGSNEAERMALIADIKANNTNGIKEKLGKYFTDEQLANATIKHVDKTKGGDAKKTKTTITISCCPLTIIISI